MKKYHLIALGGTFDLFHLGHQSLIKHAFTLSEDVILGITADNFNQPRSKGCFENSKTRRANLQKFLRQEGFQKRAKVIWLNNVYGNTLEVRAIDAILVTADSLSGAKLINKERRRKGLPELEIIKHILLKDVTGQTISSSRIKSGQIDAAGRSLKSLMLAVSNQPIGSNLRSQLKKPFGQLVQKPTQAETVIAIGDVTTKYLIDIGVKPDLAIVDLVVERKKTYSRTSELGLGQADLVIDNPPGQIARQLINAISRFYLGEKRPFLIQVIGEEDLAALPAILLAPMGAHVYYGQPGKGLVEVKINLKLKNKILKLLQTDK